MIVVAVKRAHSKAPKTVAACRDRQTDPRRQPVSVRRTAVAMKPANQKIIVIISAARIPYLCAASGNRPGVMMRYARARNVHIEVKSKKFTSLGFQIDTTYAVRPRTRTDKTAWARRSGRVKLNAIFEQIAGLIRVPVGSS